MYFLGWTSKENLRGRRVGKGETTQQGTWLDVMAAIFSGHLLNTRIFTTAFTRTISILNVNFTLSDRFMSAALFWNIYSNLSQNSKEQTTVDNLSEEFAARIPPAEFSPAELQGYDPSQGQARGRGCWRRRLGRSDQAGQNERPGCKGHSPTKANTVMSTRPGRRRAWSRCSAWFVVIIKMRPPWLAVPSNRFRSPESEILSCSDEALLPRFSTVLEVALVDLEVPGEGERERRLAGSRGPSE
ncbi:mitochondrial chaperone bcs1 [Colletotrichum musicola]|uniref:Mitochondrial chaperone bcs1 n=1 Tax=Colletotrichum musicola TaxID=2175873 RepID=A0A8H6N4Z5_9PEZI|nr:mitochondrial chaperone bcs1 [Colletotrichum musicola]